MINSSKVEEEGPPKDDKEKKILLGVKDESQSFFNSRKDSKNLTIEKKVKQVVFMRRPYEGYELSCVALYHTKYLRGVKNVRPRQENKKLDQTGTGKGLTLFSPLH